MQRVTKKIMCGDVPIGGGYPVTIQSMTNTDTRDIKSTVEQIERLEDAGCEIVRCAVIDKEAAIALGEIKKRIKLPLVADIHFDYRLAIAAIENGADKIRINPGNIGSIERVKAVLDTASKHRIPIRIGVNSGSLEKEILSRHGRVTAQALAESALKAVEEVEKLGYNEIVVSLKASDIKMNYDAYKIVAEKLNYPIHIGITESGTIKSGRMKSAIGIGALLLEGIGDTMRVSLTGDPVEEVGLAKEILDAVGIRKRAFNFISCPTCGRTRVDLINITDEIEDRLKPLQQRWEKEKLKPITVAIMGCEVNGPGEAKEADLGVAFGTNKGLIFEKGNVIKSCPPSEIVNEVIKLILKKADEG